MPRIQHQANHRRRVPPKIPSSHKKAQPRSVRHAHPAPLPIRGSSFHAEDRAFPKPARQVRRHYCLHTTPGEVLQVPQAAVEVSTRTRLSLSVVCQAPPARELFQAVIIIGHTTGKAPSPSSRLLPIRQAIGLLERKLPVLPSCKTKEEAITAETVGGQYNRRRERRFSRPGTPRSSVREREQLLQLLCGKRFVHYNTTNNRGIFIIRAIKGS